MEYTNIHNINYDALIIKLYAKVSTSGKLHIYIYIMPIVMHRCPPPPPPPPPL